MSTFVLGKNQEGLYGTAKQCFHIAEFLKKEDTGWLIKDQTITMLVTVIDHLKMTRYEARLSDPLLASRFWHKRKY